ncbi:formylglycine-generating enzyme family protein, partial [bacterium]|nr:formylglycine-generating enzyme family protein [bacterium]
MRLKAILPLALAALAASAATGSAAEDLVNIPATERSYPDPATLVNVTVRISPFLMGRAEVTQAQFQAVMGYNPALHRGGELPVDNVSWWEALRYCNALSLKESLRPCYDLSSGACDFAADGYRLPTDAEWSAADSQAAPADSAALLRAANLGGPDNESVPRLLADLKSHSTRPVGSYPPNFYGLYDMRGNLWEWVNDNHDPLAEEALPTDNPTGRAWSPERTVRGGSFLSLVSSWGRGYRSCLDPERKSRFVGFRVCR